MLSVVYAAEIEVEFHFHDKLLTCIRSRMIFAIALTSVSYIGSRISSINTRIPLLTLLLRKRSTASGGSRHLERNRLTRSLCIWLPGQDNID